MQYGFDRLGANVSIFMGGNGAYALGFLWTCNLLKIMIFLEEPEIVIVMNLFEGPKFVNIISPLGGPEI